MTRFLVWLIAGALLMLAGLWSYSANTLPESPVAEPIPPRPPVVSVVSVAPQQASPLLEVFGRVTPEFVTTIAAETEGVVRELASHSRSGQRLEKDAVLLRLDDTLQRSQLASAEAAVEQARVSLIDEELRAEQALVDWARSGAKDQPPDYVARVPQLRAARHNVKSAQAAVEEAKWNLERATVRTPFNAVVVRRFVAKGSYVQPGTELIELFSTDRVEVRLPLSERQWRLLPPAKGLLEGGWPVHLVSHDGMSEWRGQVTRVEQHLEEDTLQRALIVSVENPLLMDPPLLAGTFVRAEISGMPREDVWELPTSALTDRGHIWLVTEEGLLDPVAVAALGSRNGRLLVTAPNDMKSRRVVVKPLLNYLPGMRVDVAGGASQSVQ